MIRAGDMTTTMVMSRAMMKIGTESACKLKLLGHLHIMIGVGNMTTTMMIMSRTMIIVMVMLMPIWAE